MISYTCTNCGAQLELSDAGGFTCAYCGSRAFMSDSELKGNMEFRKKILSYYKAKAIEKEDDYSGDTLWEETGKDAYKMKNGQIFTIAYMDKYAYPKMFCYLARKNIVYVVHDSVEADLFMRGLDRIVFPAADTKLVRTFPMFHQRIQLEGGKEALIFARKPYFYPAEVFAPLEAEHLAWVISRMENICCALEYADISHGDISPSSILINPMTHEGMLMGDWRCVGYKKSNSDLKLLRETAKRIVGCGSRPIQLNLFLSSEPKEDAYADFAYWDTVIEDGFGGHKFIKM